MGISIQASAQALHFMRGANGHCHDFASPKIALRCQRFAATPFPREAVGNHRSAVDAGIVDAGDFTCAVGISGDDSPTARRCGFRWRSRPRCGGRPSSVAFQCERTGDGRSLGLRSAGCHFTVAGTHRNAADRSDWIRHFATITQRLAVCSSRGTSGPRSFVRFLTVFTQKTALLAVGVSPRRFPLVRVSEFFANEL